MVVFCERFYPPVLSCRAVDISGQVHIWYFDRFYPVSINLRRLALIAISVSPINIRLGALSPQICIHPHRRAAGRCHRIVLATRSPPHLHTHCYLPWHERSSSCLLQVVVRSSSTVNLTSMSTGPETSTPQLSLRLLSGTVFIVTLALPDASAAHALGPALFAVVSWRLRVVMGDR